MLINADTEFVNQKAYDARREYCEEKNAFSIPMTIRTLLQDFGTAPYGFLDDDILYILTKLMKDEVVSLIYGNEVQNITAEDTLTKILKRDYYDRTIIKIRQKISLDLINNLKSVARTSFNVINLRDDEDGMVDDFKRDCLEHTSQRLNNVIANYGHNSQRAYQYPGKNVVDYALSLFNSLLKIRDVSEFFKAVSEKKDEINEFSPKIEMVLDFFKGMQREQFDEARKTLLIYDNNKDFADKTEELNKVVSEITNILTMEEPYSEIHNLPTLRHDLIEILGKMYDVKSEPIVNMINNTIEYINNEVEKSKVDNSFGENYIKTCKDVINTLEHSNELKDIFAQQTRIEQLRDVFINALEREEARLEQQEKTGEEVKPEDVVITRKSIKINQLMTNSYEINSKEDIDKYIEELKAKLLKEYELNNNLTIR